MRLRNRVILSKSKARVLGLKANIKTLLVKFAAKIVYLIAIIISAKVNKTEASF